MLNLLLPSVEGSNSSVQECTAVHTVNYSQQCQFVNSTKDCHIEEGLIDYTIFIYCSFHMCLVPLAVTILVLWLVVLFSALAITADNFFCPSLVVIAKTLHMSDNVAGVTLLAFGNGAPDVFSAYSAVQNMKNDDVGLVFGALLGAGVFLTTVVVGAVCVVGAFHAMERPFLRDLVFYIVTVYFTFYICYDQKITLVESIGFIVGYVVYGIIVVVSRVVYQYMKRRQTQLEPRINHSSRDLVTESSDEGSIDYTRTLRRGRITEIEYIVEEGEDEPLCGSPNVIIVDESRSALVEFLQAILPLDIEQWKNSYTLGRVYAVFKSPALFIIRMTVPVVDYTAERDNWNKHLCVLHCMITPVFAIFAANPDFAVRHVGETPLMCWCLFLFAGVILAVIVWFTSRREQPPVYHWVFAYIGFVAAVLWIKTIANEIVNLLQTGGVYFKISNAILGLTFLAWGNSIGDFISDVAMARRGFPRAGISACFGGPLFNTLLGIGIPFTIKILSTGEHHLPVKFQPIEVVLFASLSVSLLSTLIIVPMLKFHLNRFYGLYLISVYIIFLIIAILVETDVIYWNLH